MSARKMDAGPHPAGSTCCKEQRWCDFWGISVRDQLCGSVTALPSVQVDQQEGRTTRKPRRIWHEANNQVHIFGTNAWRADVPLSGKIMRDTKLMAALYNSRQDNNGKKRVNARPELRVERGPHNVACAGRTMVNYATVVRGNYL